MKCFDADWEEFLRWLEAWEQLSAPARRHFLNERSSAAVGVSEEGYGADLARVLALGLAAPTKTGTIQPTPTAERFWHLMRHLREFPVFDEKPTSARLQDYLLKHYTYEESQGIRSSWNKTDWDSEEWPRAFLEQNDPQGWEARWLTHAERLEEALHAVRAFRFASSTPHVKGSMFLRLTSAGRHWLLQPTADRLHDLLLAIREADGRNRYSHGRLPLVPGEFGLQTRPDEGLDAKAWMDSIWREGATEAALSLDDFLDYHARVIHPLVSPAFSAANRPGYGLGGLRPRLHDIEEATHELLATVFWKQLVPLGCVATSIDDSDETIFRLSSAGRCYFGLDQKVEYGQPVPDARVVVQPNFEIVFLHPNLAAEIDFTPFAERRGQGVGTLFRLTRRQSLRAASEGLSADAVLETLARHSSSPVPANVTAELRAWFGSCRTLVTRRVLLIEAGDAETALRARKLLGPKCVLLGETLIECRGHKLDPKLRRKLADHGIFIPN